MTDTLTRLTTALADRYRVERELGAGGMATVYLAHDLRHERDVAIKVLHPDLGAALGADRFLAEIKTTAKLQHPHILPLLDSGSADGLLYYVMPYVQGETLRARLERETVLPIAEALRLAREIAAALDYAHRQGVVHRDVKPENVLLHDGSALVADFGIALAVQTAGGTRMTQTGLSLGTPQYMSPEQAMGEKNVDARSDLYALGAMTYEMLTGDAPFTGNTVQAIVAKGLTERPVAPRSVRDTIPPHVEQAVLAALAKLPADRPESARQFADALSGATALGLPAAATSASPAPRAQRTRATWFSAASLAITVALGAWLVARPAERASSSRTVRFTIPLRADSALYLGGGPRREAPRFARPVERALALSTDGETVVVSAWTVIDGAAGPSRLYLRTLDRESIVPIAGTDSALAPLISPDGADVAFFVDNTLRRVPLRGGSVQQVAANLDAQAGLRGATWTTGDSILFASATGIWSVPASGGTPRRVVDIAKVLPGLTMVGAPSLLADRTTLLVHAQDGRDFAVLRLDLAQGKVDTLARNACDPTVLGDSLLLFMRAGQLFSASLDLARGAVGDPVIVEADIMHALDMPNSGGNLCIGQYAANASGDLLTAPGGLYPVPRRRLAIVRPDGRIDSLAAPVAGYVGVRAARDGQRLVSHARMLEGARRTELLLFDRTRGISTSLPVGTDWVSRPAWSPDGRMIAYSVRGPRGELVINTVAAGGDEPPRPSVPASLRGFVADMGPDGRQVLIERNRILLRRENEEPVVWNPSGRSRWYPALSPDGTLLAYAESNASGPQVFLRPVDGSTPPLPVSEVGGSAVAWSADGSRLYFLQDFGGAVRMMRTEVRRSPQLTVSIPQVHLARWPGISSLPLRAWDVLPDGGIVTPVEAPAGPRATMLSDAGTSVQEAGSTIHLGLHVLGGRARATTRR